MKTHLWDVLDEFVVALTRHLEHDEQRWGDTWLRRQREGQEERIFHNWQNAMDKFRNGGESPDWLAVAGDALICWLRENRPELWKNG